MTRVIHLAALQVPFVRANPPLGMHVNVAGTVTSSRRSRGDSTGFRTWSTRAPRPSTTGTIPPPRRRVGRHARNAVRRLQARGRGDRAHLPRRARRAVDRAATHTVYGPGRDQGMTSGPTVAMLAAARARTATSGSPASAQYDSPLTWPAGCRCSECENGKAAVYNVPGITADVAEVVAQIRRSYLMRRSVRAAIRCPSRELEAIGFDRDVAPFPRTPLAEGIAATIEHFRRACGVKVRLAYGERGLEVEVPDDRSTVIVPATSLPPLTRPPRSSARFGSRSRASRCARSRSAARPLRSASATAPARSRVTSSSPRSSTRSTASSNLDDVVILVATGTHRGNTDDELRAMLGEEVVDSVRIVNHDARDHASLSWVGKLGADVPVWLNREWLDADVRITTGFVEPHFFAGFSGGPKMVAPGLAALETVLDAARCGADRPPRARWGDPRGEPGARRRARDRRGNRPDFALDVIVDGEQQLVQAFGGACSPSHARGLRGRAARRRCAPCRALRRRPHDQLRLPARPEPLPGGQRHVRRGAGREARWNDRLRRGVPRRLPDHGSYREELASQPSPQVLLDAIAARAHTVPDQWKCRSRRRSSPRARGHAHVVPHGCGARRGPPRADGRHRRIVERRSTRGPEPACACSRRAHRRFPTSRSRESLCSGAAASAPGSPRNWPTRRAAASQRTASNEPVASRTAPRRNGEAAPIV